MFRPLTRTRLAVDLSIAAVCVLLRLWIGATPVALVLAIVLFGVALGLRRLSPGLALAVAWAGAIVQMYAGASPDAANLAIPAVLYATARYGERSVRWLGLASAGLGSIVASLYLYLGRPGWVNAGDYWAYVAERTDAVMVAALIGLTVAGFAGLGLSWTLGLLARTWATARENRRQRELAERFVVVEQERNRIARDMHDVVAHSLAVVIAQADGGRYATDPASKDAALTTISATAREALADVRLLLGQLRHREEAGPQPMLADLDRLVEQLRASGLVVSLEQRGEPAPLPAAHQLAMYRIVQEALTNALRHGDTGRPVAALIDWAQDAVTITISNALDGSTPGPEGHGLPGMRERAILVGGTVDARVDGDQFLVRARIPVAR